MWLGASAAQIMRRLLTHNGGAVAICRTVRCLFHRCKTPPSISTRRAENWASPKVICQRQTRRLKRGGAQSLSQRPVQIFIGGAQNWSCLLNIITKSSVTCEMCFSHWKNSKHVQFVNLLFIWHSRQNVSCFSLNTSIWKTAQPQHLGRHTWSKNTCKFKNKKIEITKRMFQHQIFVTVC